MFDPNELAAYVRNQRKNLSLTQVFLAGRAGVSPSQVRRIEAARELPLPVTIRILRALDPQDTARTL